MSQINPGQSPNPNGSPVQAATLLTGPLLAGNVKDSDGSGTLAGLGGSSGTANVGYSVMAQSEAFTQATNGTVAGLYTTGIVIPAQSKILRITVDITTVWSGGATTMGLGTTAGTTAATALTTATGVQGSTANVKVVAAPSTAAQMANWDNVSNATFQAGGPQDIQVVILSANTGTGLGVITVEYIQGINLAR